MLTLPATAVVKSTLCHGISPLISKVYQYVAVTGKEYLIQCVVMSLVHLQVFGHEDLNYPPFMSSPVIRLHNSIQMPLENVNFFCICF